MRLRTLGGLSLEGVRFQRPKPLLLLAYLALEGPRDRPYLAELFWRAAARPRARLATALWQLRQGVPGVLEDDGVRLEVTLPCDAGEFLGALERHEIARAVELYRGAFLEGVMPAGCGVELEEWIYGTREFLASRARAALLELAETAAAGGALEEAAQRAEQAYLLPGAPAAEPDELERVHRLLFAGGSSRAAQVRSEAAELGLALRVTPEEARAQLQEVVGGGSKCPHNLLRPGTSFVGRALQLGELSAYLARLEVRVLTIVGGPGVGKTRLATEVAWRQLERGASPDGVYFVALDALSSPEAIAMSIATAMGLELSGAEEPLAQVARALGENRVLLVLDNYEHLLEGAGLVSELVRSRPQLVVLVTSRERLNLAEEWVYVLDGLALPAEDTREVAVAEASESMQLFVERAMHADLAFRLTPENLASVERICRLVEGVPLAIELAAGWVRLMTPAEIAAALEQNLDLLATEMRNVPKRHRSMRAAFEHSWRLLSAFERSVLRQLTVFRGGFTRAAAARVTWATIPVLASLVNKSLLRVLPNGRYDRHFLLYQLAREKLAELPAEEAEARERHSWFFLEWLGSLRDALWEGGQREALAAVAADYKNIVDAWRHAVRWLDLERLQLAAEPLCIALTSSGRTRDAFDLYAEVIAALDEHNADHRSALAMMLAPRAWCSWQLSRIEEAEQLANRALRLARSEGDRMARIYALVALGTVALTRGDYREARRHMREYLAVAREYGQDRYLTPALTGLASIETELGNYREARRAFQEGIDLLRKIENQIQLCQVLGEYASLLLNLGRPDKALEVAQEGVQVARTHQVTARLGLSLINLGAAHLALGACEPARDVCLEALELARTMDLPEQEAKAHLMLGRTSMAQGEIAAARGAYLQSMRLAQAIPAPPFACEVLVYLAGLAADHGAGQQAASWLQVVSRDSAVSHHVMEQAQATQEVLRQELPAEVWAGALERGTGLTMDEVLEEATVWLPSHAAVKDPLMTEREDLG